MPALERFQSLMSDDFSKGKALAEWRKRIDMGWDQLYVKSVNGNLPNQLHVGEKFSAQAEVFLDKLQPQDICVELYVGLVNTKREIVRGQAITMQLEEKLKNSLYQFKAQSKCAMSGLHGYTIRVLPYYQEMVTLDLPGLTKWAD